MAKIRVLIVDDHPVVLEGLHTMLSTDRNIEIVGEACDGAEAVKMVEDKEPNVVLMDIRMPNMDGVQATRRIKHQCPATAVIALTMYDTDAYVVDAVRAGDEPGAIYRFRPEDVELEGKTFASLHQVTLLDNLWLMEKFSRRPEDVVIIGIEPEDIDCGLELSERLRERLPRIIEIVLEEAGLENPAKPEKGA